MKNKGIAYYRTSSLTNAGYDKDSVPRQRLAVKNYANAQKIEIVQEYYDTAVSGADPIDQRKGFRKLLAGMPNNKAKIILVESASRFARDLTVQLTGHKMLKELGYDLISVDAPDSFIDDTPTAEMIRNILGAVSQFEKAQLVAKLKSGRDRKRRKTGRCEGTIPYAVSNPNLVREARRLARKSPKTGKKRSLGSISKELQTSGYVTKNGKAFSPSQIQRLIQ